MQVLISVASKHGGTAEIGAAIADELIRSGPVDLATIVAPQDVTGLGEVDAVVLGGAIYADQWLPVMSELIERLDVELQRLPVYLFASGPMGAVTDETQVPSQMRDAGERIGARSMRIFGGRVNRDVLGSVERTVMRMKGAKDGDWRDLGAVRQWANEIASDLNATSSLAG